MASRRGKARSTFLVAASMLVVAVLAVTAGAQGFRTLEAYEGAKFPTSAGVWTSLFDPYGLDSPTDGFNWGPVLDVNGDRLADVSNLRSYPENFPAGSGSFEGCPYPSPSRPGVWYVYLTKLTGPDFDVVKHSISILEEVGTDLVFRREILLPTSLDNEATGSPGFRFFIRSWTGIAAIRKTTAGEDAILVTAREASPSGFTLTTTFAVLFLDANAGPNVARWSEVNDQMNG
ncbi:MAG: hypothetical protein WBQ66_06825, partial [Blastocatellia bacterium]